MSRATSTRATFRPVFPGGGMTAKITRLVLASVLLTVVLSSALGLYGVYATARARAAETQPLALQWSARGLRDRLEQVGPELEGVARDEALRKWAAGLAARSGARGAVPIERLTGALAQSTTFEGLLVLDTAGRVLAAAGSGPGLAGVRERLRPKTALETDVMDAMQSAQLRKELAGVEATTVRVVETGRGAPLPLASVAFHDARGRRTASLHGVVRRDELATRLLGDLVGRGGNILVVVDDGRIVAAARPRDKDASGSLSPELFENPDAGLRMVFSATRGPNLTSTRPAGLYGWTLVAEQPLHEALRPLLLAALGYALAGVALVLFCTLAASRAALRWVRPLWDLLRGIRDASKGHGVDPISTAGTQAETEALIEAFNVMLGRLGSKRREIETSHRALQEQHEAFRHQYETVSKLSITDALTQVPNRRYFETQLQCEVKRLTRTGQKLVLLILDIDDFKKLNDRYGHAAGDEFLQQVARILKEMVRETDLLARFGGEEFVVVATGTTLEGAVVLAEKIRTAVAEASFIVDETMRPRKATVSIGVAEFKGSQTDLFNSADAALYRAKAAGKNCVMVAGEQDPEA